MFATQDTIDKLILFSVLLVVLVVAIELAFEWVERKHNEPRSNGDLSDVGDGSRSDDH